MMAFLQFSPFSSCTDMGFWWTLSKNKLEKFLLAEFAVEINGYFRIGGGNSSSGQMNVDYTAFDEPKVIPKNSVACKGSLFIKNTIEAFKQCDKKALLNEEGNKIWEKIKSGAALENPSELNRILLLTYVDLKKYNFYYWFAFPAFSYDANCNIIGEAQRLDECFSNSQLKAFSEAQEDFFNLNSEYSHFLIKCNNDDFSFHKLTEYSAISSLPGKIMFGICDSCSLEKYPGWPLRNYLILISTCYNIRENVEVVLFRQRFTEGVRESSHSIILTIDLSVINVDETPGVVGWERNDKGNMGPRMVNFSSSMDPKKLLEASVDLNLKLMKWRLVPDLNLDSIQSCKCLLLGSGTLGCNVARGLVGWGIRNITFIDNSNVSFSNPVRQSLFNFEDCVDGGKPKAEAAAAALKKIFPQINSSGVQLSIPMPGHFVTENCVEATKEDVKKLENLIGNHDAVFLLMDTRESRWLPTVIAAARNKLVINAALGFDSYLVMRHGMYLNPNCEADIANEGNAKESKLRGCELGCYFCNDVVAPGDSTLNRTMDQQCTVVRPGISMIAAGMAVELLISVLQHPQCGDVSAVPSYMTDDNDFSSDCSTILGIIPHHIRGFLARFSNILPVCRRYAKCTACSPAIIREYQTRGFDFLLNAFNQPSYLEDLTGLTQLYEETNETEVWELSD